MERSMQSKAPLFTPVLLVGSLSLWSACGARLFWGIPNPDLRWIWLVAFGILPHRNSKPWGIGQPIFGAIAKRW